MIATTQKPTKGKTNVARDGSSQAPAQSRETAAGRSRSGAQIAPDAEADEGGRYAGVVQLAITSVGPQPGHNPRTDFGNVQGLEELGASIRAQGILQPLIVRPAKGAKRPEFWIVAGERRWRAAKLAGLETVPCVVRALDDRDAREIAIVENLQREDLNAIDEAQGFAALVELGVSQADLSRKLGCTPSHVSNRLRLLKLPDALRKRVVSREMTPTQARDCVPLAVSAGCVKAIEQALKRCGPDDFPLSTDEFREVITWQVLREHGQRMDKSEYLYNNGGSFTVPPLSPSDEERARLNVVTFDGSDYALNRKLFDQLYEAHKRATIERHEAKAKKKAAGKIKDAKASPTEAKRDEKRKHDELAARVALLKRAWLLALVGEAIAGTKEFAVLARLAFTMHRFTELDNVADRLRFDGLARWQTSAGKRPAELAKWFADWLSGFLGGERSEASNELLAELVRFFKIDEEAAWRRGKLGERTEKFYSVHNGEQLVALGNELGLYLAPSKPKRIHLQVMLGQTKALPYPSILKRAKLV